jgi:hypothetical protein
VNGRITCRFQRLTHVSSNGSDTVYSLDAASYYILMAQGLVSGGMRNTSSMAPAALDNNTAYCFNLCESFGITCSIIMCVRFKLE